MVDRTTILKLAAEAELDPRTVKKALADGVETLRSDVDQARLRKAAKKLSVKIG